MGLRGRLALFFVVITVVPLVIMIGLLQLRVERDLRERSSAELASVRGATTALIEASRARAGDLATDLVLHGAGPQLALADPVAAQTWLDDELALGGGLGERADVVVLADPAGTPLATAATRPALLGAGAEVAAPTPDQLAEAAVTRSVPPGVLLEVREVRGALADGGDQLLGYVVAGVWTDARLLDRLGIDDEAAFVAGGRVLAAAGAPDATRAAPELPSALPAAETVVPAQLGGERVLVTVAPLRTIGGEESGAALVLWSPARSDRARNLALALLLPTVVVAALFGHLLARTVIAPVRRAADAARAIAGGDLTQQLEARGGPELAELAVALNTMSAELDARMRELRRSKDELRRSLARLGETLSSSLDLNRTLAVVVETARDTLSADQALLLLLTPEKDALYTKVARGTAGPLPRLRLGEGLAGKVAATGTPLTAGGGDQEEGVALAPCEPAGASAVAVPMVGRGRVIGVLSLVRQASGRPFTGDDVSTLRSFAAQAAVAIENVMLHQEAQRLSVTDSLTGLWNFRYFQLQADRELESAGRFQRDLSLLIVDIDHFKAVNDRYGHQVGDEVLIEIARRIRDATRVPDVVARYGGEEFVVLLPGTPAEGAVATAERILGAVGGSPVQVDGAEARGSSLALAVTCSIGVAAYPDHGRTVAGLLRSADVAMYAAKNHGRNRVMEPAHASGAGPGAGDQGAGEEEVREPGRPALLRRNGHDGWHGDGAAPGSTGELRG